MRPGRQSLAIDMLSGDRAAKPFGIRELLTRLPTALQHHRGGSSAAHRFSSSAAPAVSISVCRPSMPEPTTTCSSRSTVPSCWRACAPCGDGRSGLYCWAAHRQYGIRRGQARVSCARRPFELRLGERRLLALLMRCCGHVVPARARLPSPTSGTSCRATRSRRRCRGCARRCRAPNPALSSRPCVGSAMCSRRCQGPVARACA
jgi:DNA-binding response OmpR family regulator